MTEAEQYTALVQDRHLSLSPANPELRSLLTSTVVTPLASSDHVYGLSRSEVSLLNPDLTVVQSGLLDIVDYWLQCNGQRAQVHVAMPRPIDSTDVPNGRSRNAHVLRFVQCSLQGLLIHQLGTKEQCRLLGDVARGFPGARIRIVVSTEKDLNRFSKAIVREVTDVTTATRSRCSFPVGRVVVATMLGLGHSDMLAEPFDLLIFADAMTALHERSQLPLLGPGRYRLFGMLHRDRLLSPYERDRVVATYGVRWETVPRLGFCDRPVEVAWLPIRGGKPLSGGLRGSALRRNGIEAHRVRNSRIAKLAEALAAKDTSALQRLCPELVPQNSDQPCRTAIVVETVEHAVELATLLSDWPVLFATSARLNGLDHRTSELLMARRPTTTDAAHLIATVTGLADIRLPSFDVLIWAGGGGHLPTIPGDQLICPANAPHRLLLIDFNDKHHAHLRRASDCRREAYTAAGWFPVGMPPIVGRIRRFLASRPGGAA